uniref:DNA mismatch repair proteins mutS family domain-containing protein n=1 Tax=viral metagenome TaxID=1070528 RepID=A0A6C0DUR8_9ZZZZ
MYQEYIELYKTYTQKYGPKTAIFLMVGSFYELYDIQNIETGETECNVKEIVDYLGIQLSTKKGDFSENCDGLFAGFPDYVMHKWAGRLTSAGWTVVIVDQIKDVRGKVKERKVSRILSPSTHIENTTSTDTPYVVTLYFQQGISGTPSFGAGALDLTTGTTSTYSGQANGRSDIWTADDLVQMLSVFQPKELIIYWRAGGMSPRPDEQFFRRIFGIQQTIPLHIRPVETVGAFSKELVRSEYLQKIYSIKSILPAKTYLGLRSEAEEMALLFLLQFIEEHYPSMLKSFHRNEPWIPQARLICGNHALTQLQMTGTNPNETVIGLFDKSITAMGKRAMRDRLLSPYSEADEIRSRLKEIQDYMAWPEDKSKTLERQLRFMFDLPRLHRKVLCGLVTPQEIAGLFQTYSAIQVIMNKVTNDTCLKEPFTQEQWSKYINIFRANFTEEKAQKANGDMTAFNIDKFEEIGKKEKEIQEVLEGFQSLRKEIAINGGVQEDAIRLEEREKEPYGLKGSTVTLAQLKKNIKNLPDGTKISELKSGGWIDCTKLQQLNTKLQRLRESLENLVRTHLVDACLEISEAGQQIWTLIEFWISHIDCTQCIGRVSKEKGFCCPKIESIDESGSAVDIKNVRHPLVEATSSRVAYVKHNVGLGQGNKGWLVYGMNASGKSTLMKATGLCVLLAQAGCFVPAKEMTLKPFKAIYTRILNQDNLFVGLSSFAVEMSELRDILRNSNEHTLVLGDELCAGTESISAQALVASGIQWLSAKNAKFIFATHLHGLPNVINTSELGVEVWHLHVEYDPITKRLVYDRSLRPGNGSTLYGLEVARAMDLPFEFIEQALKNRHQIIGSTTQQEAMSSTWNTEIVRKVCEVCHTVITSDLEVHHIKERASASNGVLEDGTHMNDKRNLIVICEKCHDKVHGGTIDIGPVKITSDGPEREIKETSSVNSKSQKKSKWSNEEHQTIVDTLRKYSTLSLKSLRAHLSSKHEIEISEAILGKMRKEL